MVMFICAIKSFIALWVEDEVLVYLHNFDTFPIFFYVNII